MDRIFRGLAATISTPLPLDGDTGATVPDSATVQVLRADGTTLVSSTAATESPADSGIFTLALTPTQTADLDILTARWTYTLSAQAQTVETTVEIAGAPVFTLSEARELDALPSSGEEAVTTAKIIKYRTLAEQAYEDAAGVALVPRYAVETVSGDGGYRICLGRHPIREIRTASIRLWGASSVTALADSAIGRMIVDEGDVVADALWPRGVRNVQIHYEHGLDQPPERDRRAVLLLAKTWLTKGPIDDRATSLAVQGGDSIPLLVPGRRGVTFGIPEVDAALERWQRRRTTFGAIDLAPPRVPVLED